MSNSPYYQHLYELKQLGKIAKELKRMNDLKEKEMKMIYEKIGIEFYEDEVEIEIEGEENGDKRE